ncbi:hypothetical protein TNCV_1257531 [Trichonephila clavipes]|nr:hypothetical protein TNCV_1257531 [Trichonephila clavipes]
MATGSFLTQNYSRSQSEIQGDLHILRIIIQNVAAVAEWYRTATAGSDVVQSGRPIFDDFFQYLWPYIGNNTAYVVFQMVKRLCLIRIDQ